jgi:DNA-binding MarR family transcriptional regulator
MLPLNELVEKTERAVETAVLWLRILKALKRKPSYMSELRRELNPRPHMTTFQLSLYLMERMGLVRREGVGRVKTWHITEKGSEVLSRATEHLKRQMAVILEP